MSIFLTDVIDTSEKSVAGILDSGRKFVVCFIGTVAQRSLEHEGFIL